MHYNNRLEITKILLVTRTTSRSKGNFMNCDRRRTVFIALFTCLASSCLASDPAMAEVRKLEYSQHPALAAARNRVAPIEPVGTAPITIDGDLAEWEPLNSQSVVIHQSLDYLTGPLEPGSKDAAAFKLRYDDKALYFAARVVDASVTNPYGPLEYFYGDCVELFLDLRPLATGGGRKLGDSLYSEGVYQLFFVPPTSDGKPLRWTQCNDQQKQIGRFEMAGRLLPDGYAIEVRIPYSSLAHGSRARLTQPIGFDVMLDDHDAGQDNVKRQQRVYMWGGLREAYRMPSRFGLARAGYRNPAPGAVRVYPALRHYEEQKHWIRTSAFLQRATPAPATPIQLNYHWSRGSFEKFEPPKPVDTATPTAAPSTPAAEPEILPAVPVQTTDYPQLGLALHTLKREWKTFAAGRYSFDATFAGIPNFVSTNRLYGLAYGEGVYLEELVAEPAGKSLLQQIGATPMTIYPFEVHPVVGNKIEIYGGLRYAANIWWELSERAQLNLPPYRIRYDVVTPSDSKSAHTYEADILNARGGTFTVPGDKLPAGKYEIKATALAPGAPGATAESVPFSRHEDILGRRMVTTPEVPLIVMTPRDPVLKATITDAARMLTKAVEVGSPNRERFSKDDAEDSWARSVWDLYTFQGRLYVGCGDWNNNRNPIDIWSYGKSTNNAAPDWKKDFTVDDESVDVFREFDGKLYVPGRDSEKVVLGNLYTKSGIKWQKQQTIPDSKYVLDAARFQGKLYTTTGTDHGAALFESSNEGKSWKRVGESWKSARFFEMAPLRAFLLIMPEYARYGAFTYRNGKLENLNIPLFPKLPANSYESAQRLELFGDGVLYTVNTSFWGDNDSRAPLYFLNDFERGAVTIEPFLTDRVTDIVVRDGKCHVLTANSKGEAHVGAVYTSTDLKSWIRAARFTVPAKPQSLEILDGKFYVGLASPTYRDVNKASGSVWRIDE